MSYADLGWQSRAACLNANPRLFHPGQWAALDICNHCPVRTECLQYALDFEAGDEGSRHGIYGGFTKHQRKKIARGEPPGPALLPAIKNRTKGRR